MLTQDEIQIRDPFVLPVYEEKKYFLFGTTDKNPWVGKATGFDVYISENFELWDGPFPAFRPAADFWACKDYWAPEVHFLNGRHYMFASFKADGRCRGTQILASEKPQGPYIPYSDGPVTPSGWECLDGTLFIDEQNVPWMIFCHEWLQVKDGEMCAVRLKQDMKSSDGQPLLLFRASDAPWTCPFAGGTNPACRDNYITDGPYIYKTNTDRLLMLWSSCTDKGYALGIAHSDSGKITGPWRHDPEPIFCKDGGHGMLFKTFDGKLMLTVHAPNRTPDERPVFIEIEEVDGNLIIVDSSQI